MRGLEFADVSKRWSDAEWRQNARLRFKTVHKLHHQPNRHREYCVERIGFDRSIHGHKRERDLEYNIRTYTSEGNVLRPKVSLLKISGSILAYQSAIVR